MIRYLLVFCSLSLLACRPALFPAGPPASQRPSVAAIRAQLARLAPDSAALSAYWTELRTAGIPYVAQDSVLFLYWGEAKRVQWNGDFNGWGGNSAFRNQGERLGTTNLWTLATAFPPDARLDYKIVLNGQDWQLDPANPQQQWGGRGPNSELRMPAWQPDASAETPVPPAQQGRLLPTDTLFSKALNYAVTYQVYLPSGYSPTARYATIYVTDGHEYADPRMGGMRNVLDNLVASKRIEPLIAVFIDPRNPQRREENRRMAELPMNPAFADFVAQELVPVIEGRLPTKKEPGKRAILGTSLGGIFSSYLGLRHPSVFGLIGVHSPAYWFRPELLQDYQKREQLPLKFYLSTGVINDTETEARRMRDILVAKGYPLTYREVNQGHSWGNWRGLIDEVLLAFFAVPEK